MTQPKIDLEDVLNAIMLAEQEPDYKALQRWCKRYPEHRDALARFFATWAIQVDLPMDTSVDESELASLGVSRALNILNQQENEMKAPTEELSGSRLLVVCHRAGVSEQELASKIGLDESIIAKLDLRRLSSIPGICFERIAEVLHTSIELVRPLITGPPVVQAGVRYKSAQRPQPKVEDFATAVRSSSLQKRLQEYWLDAVAKERERREL
jgi:hypothetical protein